MECGEGNLEDVVSTALHILAAVVAAKARESRSFNTFSKHLELIEEKLPHLDKHLIEEAGSIADDVASRGGDLNELEAKLKRYFAEYISACYRPRVYSLDCSSRLAMSLARLYKRVISYRLKLEKPGIWLASGGPLYTLFEVSVPLHPVLDTLYIPASTLKGALRASLARLCAAAAKGHRLARCIRLVYTILGAPEELPDEEYQLLARLLDDDIRLVTEGLGARASCIHFTDALLAEYPEDSGVFEPWVITPHYKATSYIRSEYDVNPTPVIHVVMRPGLVFEGLVAIRGECLQALGALGDLLGFTTRCPEEILVGLLAKAAASGIGARTTRGYSAFKLTNARLCHRGG